MNANQRHAAEKCFLLAAELCAYANECDVRPLVSEGHGLACRVLEMAWRQLGIDEATTRTLLHKTKDEDCTLSLLSDCFREEREARCKAGLPEGTSAASVLAMCAELNATETELTEATEAFQQAAEMFAFDPSDAKRANLVRATSDLMVAEKAFSALRA